MKVLGLLILLWLLPLSAATVTWQDAQSYQDVIDLVPKRVASLFAGLDLDRPELASVHKLWQNGDQVGACAALFEHFKTSERGAPYRQTTGSYTLAYADHCLEDMLLASGIWAKVPRLPGGGIDWSYRGPPGFDNNQFGQINRHGWMRQLLFAGLDGKGERYFDKLDSYIRDWCIHAPEHHQYATSRLPGNWPRMGDRKLNAAYRLKQGWPTVFFSFLPSPRFRDASKLLMLIALHEHGVYLRQHHAAGINHLISQITALAILAATFPEFKESTAWLQYAQSTAKRTLAEAVYPSGVSKKLCQNYHVIEMNNRERLEQQFQRGGLPRDPQMDALLEKGYEYLAYSMKPNGWCMLFNDANDQSFAPLVRRKAEQFNRPDWLYPLSNGAEGGAPRLGPSLMMPWSGRLISRNGWDRQAHWSAFDIGPWGIGHQHDDKLSLCIHAFGRDLLVDSGRYTYKNFATFDARTWRGYFRGSLGHNLILVDSMPQRPGPKAVEKPAESWHITDTYDFALGSHDAGWFKDFGGKGGMKGAIEGQHRRAVVYLRDRFWLVLDHVTCPGKHQLQTLWHFHPDCSVKEQGNTVETTDADTGNLRLIPVAAPDLDLQPELIKGREKPTPQGWYSPKQNVKVPSTCVTYQIAMKDSATFAWLLVPGAGAIPDYLAELMTTQPGYLHIRVHGPDGWQSDIAVDLTGTNKVKGFTAGLDFIKNHAVWISVNADNSKRSP